jgi:protein translocase SecG subunit
MDPEDVRKLVKRVLIIGSFFALAVLFYWLGRDGSSFWRGVLVAYAVVVTVIMVLAILLQRGKGGGLASLGGMGGDNLLGARAATPIAKATAIMGALFLFICLLIARLPRADSDAREDVLDVGGATISETGSVSGGDSSSESNGGEEQ